MYSYNLVIRVALILLISFQWLEFNAQSQGPQSTLQGTNVATIGSTAWTSPNNVLSSNDAWANGTFLQQSNYLLANNFSFSIPSCATITGVEVSVERGTAAKPGVSVLNPWAQRTPSTFPAAFTYSTIAGANRMLVLVVGIENGTDRDVTAVTYGGQAMTLAGEVVVTGNGTFFNRTEIWILNDAGITAATGNAFALTVTGTPFEYVEHLSAVLLANVDQSNPIFDTSSNTQANSTPTINLGSDPLNVGIGDMVLTSVVCGNVGSFTPSASYNEGFDQNGASGGGGTPSTTQAQTRAITAAGTENPTLTFSATPNRQALLGVVFRRQVYRDVQVRLFSAGSPVGNNLANTTVDWPTTDASVTYGGAGNLWGATLTPAIINNTNFGVGISVIGGNAAMRIDHVTMRVFFTNENSPPTITCPANISVNASPGSCGAVVNYTINASDNCDCFNQTAAIPGFTFITQLNGHSYYRSNGSATWPVARNTAISLGAHLVTISSVAENNLFTGLGLHWGGLTDEVTEGTWLWSNGEPVTYTNWSSGEPNNSGGNQDYLVLNWSGTAWDDQGTITGTSYPYIIEFSCLPLNLVSGLASGSTFPVGTTTVSYNATDAAGNTSSTCSFTVTVTDATGPTITCSPTVTLNAGAVQTEDFEAGAIGWTPNTTETDPATTRILGRFGGSSGAQEVSKTFTLPGTLNKVVTFDLLRLDSWDGENIVIYVNDVIVASYNPATNNSGTTGPVSWTSTVLGTITPNAFSGTWADQRVRVVLNVNDGLNVLKLGFGSTLNQSIPDESYGIDNLSILYNNAAACSATSALPSPVVTDNCGVATLANNAPSQFPLGSTPVTWTATDVNGNVSTCQTNVTVLDIISPNITCPSNQTVSIGSGCTVALANYTSLATTSDNCGGTVTVTQSPAAGTILTGPGTTAVTLTATDASGNTSTCTFNVIRIDNTPPVMTCPSNITVNANSDCQAAVTYTTPTATDNCNCAPASIPGYVLIGTFDGHTYFRSTTSSTWTAANAACQALGGHLATITSTAENTFLTGIGWHWIGVSDQLVEGTWVWVNNEPSIYTNWLGGQPDNNGNQDFAIMNGQWDDQSATATFSHILEFDCTTSALGPVILNGFPSGSIFPLGTTAVTYQAADGNGNVSTCSFNVTVTDNIAPTLNCPSNVNAVISGCSGSVTVPTPINLNNSSACTPIPAGGSCGVGNGEAFTGMTINTGQTFWYSSTGTFANITLNGGILRVCGNLTLSNITFTSGSIFIEPGGTLTISAGGAFNLNGNCNIINRGTINLSRNTTLQNANNLLANATSSAVWNQNANLVINNNASRFVNLGTATINNLTLQNSTNITQVCLGPASTLALASISNSSTNAVSTSGGPSCIRYTGSAALNNNFTSSSDLNICRATGSTVSGTGTWGSAIVSLNCSSCSPLLSVLTVNDNCSIASISNSINGTNNASGTYPVGTTNIVWTVTDNAGNTSTCTQVLTVTENIPPTITCPGAQNLILNSSCSATLPDYRSLATIADNCTPVGNLVVTQSPAVGTVYTSEASLTVTLTVTDASGNSSNCSFSVNIDDTTNPTAICQNATLTLNTVPPNSGNASISGIINTYAPVTAIGSNTITIGSTSGASTPFAVGNKVLVIQMKGASYTTTNDVNHGSLINIGNAGNFEFGRITEIVGNTITLQFNLVNTYDIQGVVQLVRIPEYNNVTVSGVVSPLDWNGTVGGVVAFDAAGTVTLNANVSAQGNGFRGGARSTNFFDGCPGVTGFVYPSPSGLSGEKGESIALPQVILGVNQNSGRGRIVNGGGGGNDTNTGGGGGSNGGAGGSGGTDFCNNPNIGGVAGLSMATQLNANRLFLGGAGGGGHQNDGNATAGADGGGIIILKANSIVPNGFTINANGSNAANAGNDGGGGGGAGGAILLEVNTISAALSISANGGNGGNCSASHGPGAGGSGGYIWHSGSSLPANLTTNVIGGTAGTDGVTSRGSTAGSAGLIRNNFSTPVTAFTILNPSLVNNGSFDNCGIASLSVSPSIFDCTDVGANSVTLTVTDINGNVSTCTSTVTVTETVPPTIVCPSNITANVTAGACNRSVVTPNPTTGDNCGVTRLTWALTGATTGASAATGINNLGTFTFNVGVTTVTYTVRDAAGNTATCSFNVTINDNIPPSITCPSNITANASATACNASITVPNATTSDNCGIAQLTWISSGATIAASPVTGINNIGTRTFNVGVSSITYIIVDVNGLVSSCIFTITVTDNVPPTITCPANITANVGAGTCTASVNTPNPTTGDNCGVTALTWALTGATTGASPVTGINNLGTFVFNLGTTTVTYTVRDAANNTATCSYTVTVTDNILPTVTCPANVSVNVDAGLCSASVNTPNPTTGDNCAVTVLTWALTGATTGASPVTGINNLGTFVTRAMSA